MRMTDEGRRHAYTISLLVTGLPESGSKPLETFVETIARRGAGRLDVLERAKPSARRRSEKRGREDEGFCVDVPKHVVASCGGQAYL